MSEEANAIYDLARMFTWEQAVALVRQEILPQASPKVRAIDEKLIELLDNDLKRQITITGGDDVYRR